MEASRGFGGQEIRIITECLEFKKKGHEILLICQPDAAIISHLEEASLAYIPVAMNSSMSFSAISSLCKIFKKEKPDVVHTHSSLDSWVGGFAGKLSGVPLLIRTRHVSIPVKNPIVYKYLTDTIITTGSSIRNMFIDKLKIKPEEVHSIPTGVDLKRFTKEKYDRNEIRKSLNIEGDVPVISIIGVLRGWKGHHFFVDAAKKVLETNEAIFHIIGCSPVGENPLYEVIKGYEKNIRILGYRKDIPEMLAASDILVSASTSSEGVSQSIIQALAMEKGVIATDVGSTSDIIKHNKTGLLIQHSSSDAIADAILELISSPDQIKQLGTSGRECVEANFDISSMADKIEKIYYDKLNAQ